MLLTPLSTEENERLIAVLAVPAVLLKLFNLRVAVFNALLRLSTLPVMITRNSSIVILPHLLFQVVCAFVRYAA